MNSKLKLTVLVVSLFHSINSANAQETIVRDPISGDYIINYQQYNDDGGARLSPTTFIPKTKVAPLIKSSFRWKKDVIDYRYTVVNETSAKQDIHMFVIAPVSSIVSSQSFSSSSGDGSSSLKNAEKKSVVAKELSTPKAWRPFFTLRGAGGARLGWTYQTVGGIPAGSQQTGYGFSSVDLPGIVSAEVRGSAPPGQGPGENSPDPNSEFGKQYNNLVVNNFVPAPVAAPVIVIRPLSKPIDVVQAIQLHIRTWPTLGVIDQAATSKIDSMVQKVVDALNSGNNDDAKAALKSVRQFIRQNFGNAESEGEREDIDRSMSASELGKRLAFSVLAFDVRYVLKSLNNGQDIHD